MINLSEKWSFMKKLFMLLGRICLSVIFLSSAVNKLFSWDQSVQFLNSGIDKWVAGTPLPDFMHQGVTLLSSYSVLLMIIATIFEGVGALCVLLGFKVRLGATLLILFLIPVTIIMHPFWLATGQEKILEMGRFMSNIAILGGLFILAAKAGESDG